MTNEATQPPSEHADDLNACIGKTIASWHQEPGQPEGWFDRGEWQDEQPITLHFTDGSSLTVGAYGWHDSGSLGIGFTSA